MAAESSLLELIEAMLMLASQSNDIFPPKPAIKPGGYPEDIFTNLSEQEKEDYACAICYQILKEPMQCVNQHKFCHSCIYVWSTTGVHMNRTRCPVCRCSSRYQRCMELDTLLGEKRVKCNKTACRWSGTLKFFNAHRHTYSTKTEGLPTGRDVLPNVRTSQRVTPVSSMSSSSQESPEPSGARVRATVRVNPYLRLNIPAGRNSSIGNRDPQATQSRESSSSAGDSSSLGESSEEVTVIPLAFTPRPPSGPRPTLVASIHRRTPTLPSLITPSTPRPRPSQSSPSLPVSSSSSTTSAAGVGSSSNNVGSSSGAMAAASLSPPPAGPWRPRYSREQNQRDAASLGNIRQRLQENRQRLDSLMASFSGELERSRQEAAEFQQERERLRRQQLEEVREMGRRLGHVAAELRRLLNERQRPAPAASSDSDSDLDDLLS